MIMNDWTPPQSAIEEKMREISERGNYEMVHLLSSEGLPLAEYYLQPIIEKDRLVELSVLFREVKKVADMMGNISSIKEMIVEGTGSRKIVFRFFQAFGEEVALVVVVPPKKSYRALTNQLIHTIEKVSF
jgi:hypothetical protein